MVAKRECAVIVDLKSETRRPITTFCIILREAIGKPYKFSGVVQYIEVARDIVRSLSIPKVSRDALDPIIFPILRINGVPVTSRKKNR